MSVTLTVTDDLEAALGISGVRGLMQLYGFLYFLSRGHVLVVQLHKQGIVQTAMSIQI